jgi:hypothetical protein
MLHNMFRLPIYRPTYLIIPVALVWSFVSLQFTPWTGDQQVARQLSTQDNTNTQYTQIKNHALSGIRTHNPTVRRGEDITCLRLRGRWDRPRWEQSE